MDQTETVSQNIHVQTELPTQDGGCVVFFQERALFGNHKPTYAEFVKHEEMYGSLSKSINPTHLTGLQRINGMWRIYLDNVADKATLIAKGVTIRGRSLPILPTNPLRLDSENTTRIRIQNIPLSADDGTISRALILKGLDVISTTREKLRINGKLTNCETGDRIVLVKSSTLTEPLHRFMTFGQFKAKVIHRGQVKPKLNCSKCLAEGHTLKTCPNEWKCRRCNQSGHKQGSCPIDDAVTSDSEDNTLRETSDDEVLSSENSTQQDMPTQSTKAPKQKHSNDNKTQPKPRASRERSRSSTHNSQQLMDKFVQCDKATTATPEKTGKSSKYVHSPPTPGDSDSKKVRSENT